MASLALIVKDGAFSYKIDYVTIFRKFLNGIKIASLVQELRPFCLWVDFAIWWSFSGQGSAINGATPSSFQRNEKVSSKPQSFLFPWKFVSCSKWQPIY